MNRFTSSLFSNFDPRIYLFTIGHFSIDWAQGAIPALLPYFIDTCHLSYQDAGTLVFANILLSSIIQPIFGYYADRVSRPWFAPLGTIISGVSIAAIPFVTSYWVLFFLSMISGLGSAIYHPEAARMVNGLAGEHKGKALGTFSVGGNAGFAVGPMSRASARTSRASRDSCSMPFSTWPSRSSSITTCPPSCVTS